MPDPKDYWMLDLAYASGADFVVTWDPRLLDHEVPLPVEVVTPARFLEELGRRDPGARWVSIQDAPYRNRTGTGQYAADKALPPMS